MCNSNTVMIISGVLIFVIGQFIVKLMLDPVVSFKIQLGELSAIFLKEHANIIGANSTKETQNELKKISS